MKKNTLTKIINIGLSASFILLVISMGITLVILFRPLYYWQIKSLNIPAESGLNYDQIKYQYDQTMNYLLFFRRDFDLKYITMSPAGIAHFRDVRVLFLLNFIVLFLCIGSFTTLMIIRQKLKLANNKPYHPLYYASWGALLFLLGIFILVIINGFDESFIFFHKIFFPGKENFIFDPAIDSIILLLPAEYFLSCGALMGGFISGGFLLTALLYFIKGRRYKLHPDSIY